VGYVLYSELQYDEVITKAMQVCTEPLIVIVTLTASCLYTHFP
jgi:hypothetical protein